jgi:hypothetical protein
MGNVENITTGPSLLFLAPVATALPTLTGAQADFTGFDAPGFTLDGVEWDYTPTFKDLMVDEKLAPVKKKITAHKLVVSAKLAEPTLKNVAYALAGATFNGTDTLTIGSPEEAPEFRLGWMGPAPGGGTRSALVFTVISIAASKAHYQRKDMASYNVQFEALSDSTQPSISDLAIYKDFPAVPFTIG